jgi:hypothetical protein
VTIRKAIKFSIGPRRVPLSKLYSPISKAFRTTLADETENLINMVAPERGGVEVGGIGVLPAL